jgi:uncharacterized ion transporter superfamily protein YfcC
MLRWKFPPPLVLLVGGILLAAVLTYLLPAGEYDRREDPVTGRKVVVPGTFHSVPSDPVTPFQALVAIPRGLSDASSVVFLVFLVGGAFTVVDKTGALHQGVSWLVGRLRGRMSIVVPTVCIAFATGGALENLQEEIIPMVPVLLLLSQRLGMDAITAVAMCIGAASIGAAFSPINPFQVGIAQKLASLPLLSGMYFRIAFLIPAVGLWIWGTLRYAARIRTAPPEEEVTISNKLDTRITLILVLVLATFGMFIFGVTELGWDFDQMSALFFLMGVLSGFIGKLGVEGTADAFVEGFRSMAFAGLLIGFARAIFVVLNEGHVIDTIVHGLFMPLASLPVFLSAVGMMVAQTAIHVPVPSVSGQAVLTMPVLVPLSDLLQLPRQVTVLAYQYGTGLCEVLTPTNGALMAILAAAGVPFGKWIRFVIPLYLLLFLLGVLAVGVGILIDLK